MSFLKQPLEKKGLPQISPPSIYSLRLCFLYPITATRVSGGWGGAWLLLMPYCRLRGPSTQRSIATGCPSQLPLPVSTSPNSGLPAMPSMLLAKPGLPFPPVSLIHNLHRSCATPGTALCAEESGAEQPTLPLWILQLTKGFRCGWGGARRRMVNSRCPQLNKVKVGLRH